MLMLRRVLLTQGNILPIMLGCGLNLLEAMRAEGRRIVFASTCATYGMAETGVISKNGEKQPFLILAQEMDPALWK